MMNRQYRSVGFASFLASVMFVACSSTGAGPSGGTDAGSDGSVPSEAAAAEASVQPESDGGTADARAEAASFDAAAGECGFHPKQTACTNCCVAAHNDGAGAYLFAVAECMCVEARCQKECNDTFCAPEPRDPDATCNACITAKTGECSGPIMTSCNADPDCVAFDRCMGESGCLSKPQ